METAKLLLGEGKELNGFVARLLDDIANLKAMLHAISIGKKSCKSSCFLLDHGHLVMGCSSELIIRHVSMVVTPVLWEPDPQERSKR